MADNTSETPLSAAELTTYRDAINQAREKGILVDDMHLRLFATVAARDAELAAYREVVAELAANYDRLNVTDGEWTCRYCEDYLLLYETQLPSHDHSDNCPVRRAYALLASGIGAPPNATAR